MPDETRTGIVTSPIPPSRLWERKSEEYRAKVGKVFYQSLLSAHSAHAKVALAKSRKLSA
jgi:hypothetical protein